MKLEELTLEFLKSCIGKYFYNVQYAFTYIAQVVDVDLSEGYTGSYISICLSVMKITSVSFEKYRDFINPTEFSHYHELSKESADEILGTLDIGVIWRDEFKYLDEVVRKEVFKNIKD